MTDPRPLAIRWLALVALALGILESRSAEGQQVWEFSPYRVQVWVAFDWSLDLPDHSQTRLLPAINDALESAFQAAWSVEVMPAPQHLEAPLLRGLESITLDSLSQSEFELAVVKDAEEANAVRSYEGALERLEKIAVTHDDLQTLTQASAAFRARHPELDKLLSKCTAVVASTDELVKAIESKQALAALVPRSRAKPLATLTRTLPALLPWQTQHLFRELDKVFLVIVSKVEGEYEVAARELDCPMRFVGPVIRRKTGNHVLLPACARQAIVSAFAPVTRVEDTTLRWAQMTLRAGGLITDFDNPAMLHPGDILQPIIRRDDRNGIPSILEPLPWTFAAVTASDGIQLEANVYSGISGALQGRRNRRTQRVALKVRPTGDATDMKVVVRLAANAPQIGCEIFLRDLATENITLLGRTDWRGVLTIPASESSQAIVPEKVRLARAAAKKAADEEALKQKPSAAPAPATTGDSSEAPKSDSKSVPSEPPASASAAPAAKTGSDAAPDEIGSSVVENSAAPLPETVPLRQPFVLLYVKSGETVLARLPMVPGLTPLEVAELPSDARRLEAEAYVSGFQSEILDLIGQRSLLEARAKQRIKDDKLDEARQFAKELRDLPTYTVMADRLDGIQRKVLDETNGPIPMNSKPRIDRMFQTTRDMLQKYLHRDLPNEMDRLIEQSRQPSNSQAIPADASESPVTPEKAEDAKKNEGSNAAKG